MCVLGSPELGYLRAAVPAVHMGDGHENLLPWTMEKCRQLCHGRNLSIQAKSCSTAAKKACTSSSAASGSCPKGQCLLNMCSRRLTCPSVPMNSRSSHRSGWSYKGQDLPGTALQEVLSRTFSTILLHLKYFCSTKTSSFSKELPCRIIRISPQTPCTPSCIKLNWGEGREILKLHQNTPTYSTPTYRWHSDWI